MRRTLLPLTLAATVLAACGGSSSSAGTTARSAAPAATAAAPGETSTTPDSGPAVGAPGSDTTAAPTASAPSATAPEALQFSAPLVGGGTIDFTQFAGKTVALWFWAPT